MKYMQISNFQTITIKNWSKTRAIWGVEQMPTGDSNAQAL